MVAEQEADLGSSLVQHQQQVAGLLGDPAAVGVGRHPAEMDPSAVELDEAQHLQPPQPDRIDGEAVTDHDPGGLLAQERLPGRGRPSWRGVEPVAAQCRADRGR